MNVGELIAILQTLDPSAEVVTATNDDHSDGHHVLELRRADVRTIAIREIFFERPWFDVDHGAKLYQVDADGLLQGVEIG